VSETAWTWVLLLFEIVGLTGTWLVGNRKWYGWGIILVHSIPWFIYSIIYNKPGFIAMALMWWTVNFINMVKWRNNDS
jgi:hypothetical protein